MKKNSLISMEHVPQHGHNANEAVAVDRSRELLASCDHIKAAVEAAKLESAAYRRAFDPVVPVNLGFSATAQAVPTAEGVLYETDPQQSNMDELQQRIEQAYANDTAHYYVGHPREQSMDQNFKDLGYNSNVAA